MLSHRYLALYTTAAAGAALSASLTGVSTVTAGLTTQITLSSSATAVCTVSPTMIVGIQIAATLHGVCTVTAKLPSDFIASLSVSPLMTGSLVMPWAAIISGNTVVTVSNLYVGSQGTITTPQPMDKLPHTYEQDFNGPVWQRWLKGLANRVQEAGQITWGQLTFSGSKLTDIADRKHNDLQAIQGGATGDNYHVTKSTYSDLTSVVTKTASYTATLDDGTILCDATSAAITITLPTAVGIKGKTYNIKKIDIYYGHAVTVTSVTAIDNSTTWIITDPQTSMQVKSDGAVWRII